VSESTGQGLIEKITRMRNVDFSCLLVHRQYTKSIKS